MKYTYELLVQMVFITGTAFLSGVPSSPPFLVGFVLLDF